jgi:hypothetical protein
MFDFIFSALGTLFGFAASVASAVITVVSKLQSRKVVKTQAIYERNKTFDQLYEANEEIEYLKRQRYKDSRELARLNSLYDAQQELIKQVTASREIIAADKFIENKDTTENLIITPDNLHILQWNSFADVVSKKCPNCGRLMKIQWKKGYENTSSMFWGCVGYLTEPKRCKHKIALTRDDFRLITDTSSEEHKVSFSIFKKICNIEPAQIEIEERMQALKGNLTDMVCCPYHGVPMVLNEKKYNDGSLLDKFHLKCPYYRYDKTGCDYMEKFKSYGQLAAFLKHTTGRGILYD